MTLDDLLSRLASECAKAGSQKAWAERHDLAPAYVSDVLQKRRDPAGRLLKALGVERVVTYQELSTPARKMGEREDG